MGARKLLRDSQWVKLDRLMAGSRGGLGASGKDNRLSFEGGLWIMRTGPPWRDLPAEPGNWRTTYTRLKRWGESGRWQMFLDAIGCDRNLEMLRIDSALVYAHLQAAGAQEKPGTRKSGDRVVI
jgi:putative transposase